MGQVTLTCSPYYGRFCVGAPHFAAIRSFRSGVRATKNPSGGVPEGLERGWRTWGRLAAFEHDVPGERVHVHDDIRPGA